MPFCLQERATNQSRYVLQYAMHLTELMQWQNTQLTYQQVSFMNTAGVTVVVTVLASFQFQIVLDL